MKYGCPRREVNGDNTVCGERAGRYSDMLIRSCNVSQMLRRSPPSEGAAASASGLSAGAILSASRSQIDRATPATTRLQHQRNGSGKHTTLLRSLEPFLSHAEAGISRVTESAPGMPLAGPFGIPGRCCHAFGGGL